MQTFSPFSKTANGESPGNGNGFIYERTIPSTYGADQTIIDLNPIMYEMFRQNTKIKQNLPWYFLSVETIYFQNEGFSFQPKIHHCSKADVGAPQKNNQVCIDTERRTMKTTRNFRSTVAAGLDVKIDFNLLKGSISGQIEGKFVVKIYIRNDMCDVQKHMVPKVDSCQQLAHETTTDTEFNDQVGTIFKIKSQFVNEPLVLSKIKIRATDKPLPDNGFIYLTMYKIDNDVSKVIVDDKIISTFSGNDLINIDIFDKVGSPKYKVVLKDQERNFYRQISSLSFYQLKKLCTLDAKCYQESSFWKYLKRQKSCSSTGTSPLEDNYERCIGKFIAHFKYVIRI